MTVWLNPRVNGWWFPPINTRGGGPNEDTLHTTHFTLLLSPHLRCRVVLESLGVEVLRRGAGNGALLQFVPLQEREEESGGSAGLVGTLLCLYLDGCLFGCKCLRLSYLELEFSCKYFLVPYIN